MITWCSLTIGSHLASETSKIGRNSPSNKPPQPTIVNFIKWKLKCLVMYYSFLKQMMLALSRLLWRKNAVLLIHCPTLIWTWPKCSPSRTYNSSRRKKKKQEQKDMIESPKKGLKNTRKSLMSGLTNGIHLKARRWCRSPKTHSLLGV